jgi:hypothetical protein
VLPFNVIAQHLNQFKPCMTEWGRVYVFDVLESDGHCDTAKRIGQESGKCVSRSLQTQYAYGANECVPVFDSRRRLK